MADQHGALDGLRVVDLTGNLASAYTSMVLADFGAEVVQIEPRGGSPLRSHPSWPFWGRGKKSIVLDLKNGGDLGVAKGLALDADVVIDAFRPGVAERLGLGDGDLRPANPGLVYTSITGFGATGKYRNAKSYEAVVMAKTGSMYGPNRSKRQGPVMQRAFGATMAGSLLAIQGTLIALHERTRSGHGQRVDATMVQGMLAQDPWTYFAKVLTRLYPDAFSNVMAAPSSERPVPTTWLGFGLLTAYTKDGRWMQFAHATPKQFEAFVKELGLGWTRTDPETADLPDSPDVDRRERFWDMMLTEVRKRTTAEWQEVFDRNSDTFAEIFRSPHELFTHPQIVHAGHAVEVEHPGLGTVRQMDALVKMSHTPGDTRRPAPAVDQHRDELRSRPRRQHTAPRGAPSAKPALDGVTVLDLGTFYAGPFGSTMFTDHGARVIKVEPLDGDPIRFNMPIPEWAGVRVTQGKESIALDVFSEEGKKIVLELVRRADMVLHSYRGGVAKRMGLDRETLVAINPNLVYHHAQGYGVDGPYARRAAYAPTIAAGSGFSGFSGGGGPEAAALSLDEIKSMTPFMPGAQSGHPDGFAALGAAVGLALGLVARDMGKGAQSTMTTMLSTMGHVMGDELVHYDGVAARAVTDPEMYGYNALYRIYPAASGWLVLCVVDDDEWKGLCRALDGLVDLGTDGRFATADDRRKNDASLIEVLSGVFATKAAAEWEELLLAADVAGVEIVANLGGLASGLMDPGGLAEQLGMTTEVEHPMFGVHTRSKGLFTLSRTEQTLKPGCLIGQHSESILRELGYSDERIAQLRAEKVIG